MLAHAQQFKAQRGRPRGDLPGLIYKLGLEQSLLNQPWPQLSVPLRSSPKCPCCLSGLAWPCFAVGGVP